jgi:hypothetical protein
VGGRSALPHGREPRRRASPLRERAPA